MAERPTHRRKVTGQMAIGATSSASAQGSTTSSPSVSTTRLKARVNPAGIVSVSSPNSSHTDHTPPPRPALGRTSSTASLRSNAASTIRTNSSPIIPSSSRSAVGTGSRPPVARAQSLVSGGAPTSSSLYSSPRSGSTVGTSSSTPVGGAARTRPASVIGGPAAATPPTRSPPIGAGNFGSSTGSRVRASATVGTNSSDETTPSRLHVRASSMQQGEAGRGARLPSFTSEVRPNVPRHTSAPQETVNIRRLSSSSSSDVASRAARALSVTEDVTPPPPLLRKVSRDSAVDPATRRTSADHLRLSSKSTEEIATTTRIVTTPAPSSSPLTRQASVDPSRSSSRRGSHLSSLAEVTPASINLTVSPSATNSSLLSPRTLVPANPPQHEFVDDDSLELPDPEPSSNHSSPGRAHRQLGSHSPVLHHHPQFGHVFGGHATASAPTSPVPHGLGLDNTERKQRRPPLPWNPNSDHAAPHLPEPPSSPELRTVALPLMTPTRSRDISPHPTLSGLGLHRTARRLSSSSDGSAVTPSRSVNGSRGRLSGSTIADDSDDKLGSPDVERAERAKVERKIADLEISNSSLLAINRSLEATKAKQRSEIMRLRRALRENRAGLGPVGMSPAISHPISDEEDEEVVAETENPELEARWDRLADLVGAMRRRGDEAVEREPEVPKLGQRVLGWLEVEGVEGIDSPSGIETPPE